METQDTFENEKQEIQNKIDQKINGLKKTLEICEQELRQCRRWKEVQHEAELIQANFFKLKNKADTLIVIDWENDQKERSIALDPTLEPSKELAIRFRKAKKMKRGIAPLEKKIAQLQEQFNQNQRLLDALEQADSLEKLNQIIPPAKKTVPTIPPKSLPYLEYFSASKIPIWVGKSAKKNDELTFRYAHGSDTWLHVMDYPGSHVVIRTPKGRDVDEETLQDAIQLALYYSKGKEAGHAEVGITLKKFVSRLGKQPGKVQISKHRIVYARLDPDRFKRLKEGMRAEG